MRVYYSLFSLRKRFLIFILVALSCFFALFCRLFYLTIFKGNSLQVRACDQWLRSLPLAAKRGEIFDCSGNLLVTNETTYDIYLRARNVTDPAKLALVLSQKLGVDYSKTYDKATNIKVSESLVKLQVDSKTAMEIVAENMKGVYLSQNVGRVYLYDDLLTQVLGYTTIDNQGQAGVEAYYDKFLRGIAGKSLTQTNAQGKELEDSLRYYLPSTDGYNLNLTIDLTMQLILEKHLKTAYEENKALKVGGIILDAKTGGILAMSNKPSFDLNEPPRNDISTLNNLTKNSAVVDIYEPGSTFKVITLTAGLNEGVLSLDDRFYCSGASVINGERIKCWRSRGHGSQNLAEALKNSCNCAFMAIAERLGTERLYKYIEMFGFGKKTGVDISSESSGIVMNKNAVRLVDLVRIGFGHAIAVTTLQMATAYAEIVTNRQVSPHILQSVDSITGKEMTYSTAGAKFELQQSTIDTVRTLLGSNLNGFDGQLTAVAGYDVGGKTGTAQKYVDGHVAQGKYVASFIGVYPTKDPKYIMIITVDEPSAGAYYGGVVAAPVGKAIFAEIFNAKNIAPDKQDNVVDYHTIEMPNLLGMSLASACAKLRTLGLVTNVQGEGEFIVAQYPRAGIMLAPAEEVVLQTN